MVAAAKSFNMPAVAMTDHGNLYGFIEFYKACKAGKILGIEVVDHVIIGLGRFSSLKVLGQI